MSDVTPAPQQPTGREEATQRNANTVYVAPGWKLTWLRFKKHRLALAFLWLIGLIALIALTPSLFATMEPDDSRAARAFRPPQPIRIVHDGRPTWPFVYDMVGARNPRTLKLEWVTDTETRLPIRLFVKGFEYELFGFLPMNRHLIGLPEAQAGATVHFLGTDRLGRDQWSRLMYGTQTSLSIGLVAVAISTLLGILLGGISGYYGGIVDNVIQRIIEILQSLPPIPIWLALSAALPRTWSVTTVYFAITVILALLGWTRLAREVRGRFLSLREEDFVAAARLVGASKMRIIFSHMVPSFMSHIIAAVTLAIPLMILNETFLSFLGLGMRPPAISWGVMLQEAQNLQSVVNAPWLMIPGAFVIVAVLALNIIGDGLRDAADPYAN